MRISSRRFQVARKRQGGYWVGYDKSQTRPARKRVFTGRFGSQKPEIRQFAADPAALLTIQAVRDYATLGLRQEGDSAVDLQVVGVDLTAPAAPTVRMTGCYDSQSAQTIDAGTGEVVPPGTPPRYVWDITVVRFVAEPGQPWLVTTLEPLTDRPC